jgi:transglutaminase-like putative cysteine protease
MQHRARATGSLFLLAAVCASGLAQEEKRTYAIRVDDRVVGYQIEVERPAEDAGRAVVQLDIRSLVKVELLGASIDQHVQQTWTLDPRTRAVLRMRGELTAGGLETSVTGALGADGFSYGDGKNPPKVVDPQRAVISPEFRWLLERGPKEPGVTVALDYFVPEFVGVQEAVVELVEPQREVPVLGTPMRVRAFRMRVPGLGVEAVVCVTDDGRTVRYELPAQRMVIELAPPALVERVERVDLTNTILVKTNVYLDDPAALTFMKLRARIDTTRDITVAMLTAPGQTFAGTVVDGRIDGVFEIRPRRADGAKSPAFPVPEGAFARSELQQYLRSEENIESDDAAIAAQARQLADGATSCFQVLERLAQWAHEQIRYELPGGVTAKRTMELRAGDCGGHSRVLAAMLRSLGIPARTPMGGMYVPLLGGSFGQHMWTEVWLGDAIGWLPVDCTAGQATYVDASHIRFSETITAFKPVEIEVLEYEPKTAPPAPVARRTDAWPWKAGESWTYAWRAGGRDLGTEQVTYEGGGDGGHLFASTLELAGGKLVESVRTSVGDDGGLRSLRVERTQGAAKATIEVQVDGGKARIERRSDDGGRTDAVEVAPGTFVLHNNSIAHLAIAVQRMGPLAEGAEAKLRVLHDEERSLFPFSLRGGESTTIEVGGEQVPVQLVTASLVGIELRLHVDRQGRLVRYHQKQGDVTVELQGR